MATADQLTRLGLTSYEAKAYLALVRRDSSTAAQVARLAGVPRQRIYDVLASLVEKGLASTRPGPGRQVRRRRARARARAARLRPRASSSPSSSATTAALIDELSPAFHAGQEQADPLEYIEVLRDRRAINERFDELQAGIKRRDPRLHEAAVRDAAAGERRGPRGRADARGAQRLRVLASSTTPTSSRASRRFIEAGEEARFVAGAAAQARDHRRVDRHVRDGGSGRRRSSELTIMVVEHPSLASSPQDRVRRGLGAGPDVRAGVRASSSCSAASRRP